MTNCNCDCFWMEVLEIEDALQEMPGLEVDKLGADPNMIQVHVTMSSMEVIEEWLHPEAFVSFGRLF